MRLWAIPLGLLWITSCREGRTPPAAVGPAPSALPDAAAKSAPPATGKVTLRATNPDGVPLHPAEKSSAVSGRLADGTEVEVLWKSADGRWLEVRAGDGSRGFITRRYLAGAAAEPDEPRADALSTDSPWSSPAACERALAAGRKLERPAAVARVGSWNVRWFPDGKPGKGSEGNGTNLPWLACIIAWSNVDALAVQEFKTNPRARGAVDELRRLLDAHTSGKWAAAFDDCPNTDAQHVGLVYDSKRVTAKGAATVGELNPHGQPCKDSLRPGFSMYLTFPAGLDFHFVSVHTKSGNDRRSIGLREKTLAALPDATRVLLGAERDTDVLLAGDFNTMGCKECSPPISAADELATTDRTLAALSARHRRIPSSAACSEYYKGHGTLLDHFVASASFAELGASARARVSGLCGDAACAVAPAGGPRAAERELSDHCPLFLDIPDRDLD
ncbi:MAG: hypothetical protein IT377_05550 [Polyangiaceae bacterium]|nr:hypothetical protein [Polyangiaceae bacterium]